MTYFSDYNIKYNVILLIIIECRMNNQFLKFIHNDKNRSTLSQINSTFTDETLVESIFNDVQSTVTLKNPRVRDHRTRIAVLIPLTRSVYHHCAIPSEKN